MARAGNYCWDFWDAALVLREPETPFGEVAVERERTRRALARDAAIEGNNPRPVVKGGRVQYTQGL